MTDTREDPRRGPVTVVKIGGSNVDRPDRLEDLCEHVASLVADDERVVVVHGGGPQISELQEALGERSKEVEGLRVTSREGMRITTMVLCGLVNKRLVAALVARDLPALGLSGVDLGLLRSELLDEEKLGLVGTEPEVDTARLLRLLMAGFVLVVSPVSLGPDGELVNVNADTAARAVAGALHADRLDFVTDVAGVRESADAKTPASRLKASEADRLLNESAVVVGGMRPKLESAIAAVRAGVGRVRVGTLGSLDRGECTEVVA